MAFKWLDKKVQNDHSILNPGKDQGMKDKKKMLEDTETKLNNKLMTPENGDLNIEQKSEIYTLVFREISMCFQYILKYYETHKQLLDSLQNTDGVKSHSIETDIIETIVKLGKQTKDQ